LFFGPIYTHYHLPNLYSYFVFLFFLVLVYERARAASKHVHKNKKEQEHEVFLFFLVHYSVSIYFIRIFFTSKPIHELRLDLNVANTVIALTIRVIYLSLIITLKRGVVVLWFTVTCPLSSGFLSTIIPAEQFLSPKSTKRFPHTHQALLLNPHKPQTIDTYSSKT